MTEIERFIENNKDKKYSPEECEYFNEAMAVFILDSMDEKEKREIMTYILWSYHNVEKANKLRMLKHLKEELKEFKKEYIL